MTTLVQFCSKEGSRVQLSLASTSCAFDVDLLYGVASCYGFDLYLTLKWYFIFKIFDYCHGLYSLVVCLQISLVLDVYKAIGLRWKLESFVSHLQWVLRAEPQFSGMCSNLLAISASPQYISKPMDRNLVQWWFSELLLCQGELESDLCFCLEVK